MFFCGVCHPGDHPGFRQDLQRALEEMGLPAEEFSEGPLSVWHGSCLPRAFARLNCSQGLAVAVGELVWEGATPPQDGPGELPRLLDCLADGRPEELARANGTFAVLAWESEKASLWLAADSLGGRPVYFAQVGGTLFFSTLLEVLLRLPAIPRDFEFPAFIEQEAFCYPLGDLTLYSGIRVLRDSEYLRWTAAGVNRARYFDWSSVELRPSTVDEAADTCAAAFFAAVRDRAPRSGAAAKTLLSGGLDSRCIAAVLHQMGVPLRAATLRIPGSQDYEYARRFAALLGIELEESPLHPDPPPLTTGTTTAAVLTAAMRPLLPGRVFSGDGGGETFGLLLLTSKVISLLAQNRQDAAIRAYLEGHGPSTRLFRKAWRHVAMRRPFDALQGALAGYPHLPGEKAMHLFVLINDLRRHLHDFFELAPRLGCDLALPFYDRRVLMAVWRLAPPLEPFLEHRLYHEILRRMPEVCLQVPWQTYPGRPPCPVSDDGPPLKNQWELSRESATQLRSLLGRDTLRQILRGRIPSGFIDTPALAAALAIHKAGFRDYAHVFRPALALADAVHRGEPRPRARS